MKRILITGVAGFIGFHLARRYLEEGDTVVGIDAMLPNYDLVIKRDRLVLLTGYSTRFTYLELNLVDRDVYKQVARYAPFDCVIHLAAESGVRISLNGAKHGANLTDYVSNNLVAFAYLLDFCREKEVPSFLYASSSSVYGATAFLPTPIEAPINQPLSFYAATKGANELMAAAFSHSYGLSTTALRFYTTYGPWGRPDMSISRFVKAILEGKPIALHNGGKMSRDFTYIDDLVEAVWRVSALPVRSKNSCLTYNIGGGKPIGLRSLIEVIEAVLGRRAMVNEVEMDIGEVVDEWASNDELIHAIDFMPSTTISEGVTQFVLWYRDYYSGD